MDSHTHDLSSQTLRKSNSPESPKSSPVVVPSLPHAPIVTATPTMPVRVATILPMSPIATVNGQGPVPGFVERIPSTVSKVGKCTNFAGNGQKTGNLYHIFAWKYTNKNQKPSHIWSTKEICAHHGLFLHILKLASKMVKLMQCPNSKRIFQTQTVQAARLAADSSPTASPASTRWVL